MSGRRTTPLAIAAKAWPEILRHVIEPSKRAWDAKRSVGAASQGPDAPKPLDPLHAKEKQGAPLLPSWT